MSDITNNPINTAGATPVFSQKESPEQIFLTAQKIEAFIPQIVIMPMYTPTSIHLIVWTNHPLEWTGTQLIFNILGNPQPPVEEPQHSTSYAEWSKPQTPFTPPQEPQQAAAPEAPPANEIDEAEKARQAEIEKAREAERAKEAAELAEAFGFLNAKRNELKIEGSVNKDSSPHDILGVAQDATKAVITKAFRKLSVLVHPDKNMDVQKKAGKAFTILSEAYHKICG
jgi:type IV secretory pathway VirB10-like protein